MCQRVLFVSELAIDIVSSLVPLARRQRVVVATMREAALDQCARLCVIAAPKRDLGRDRPELLGGFRCLTALTTESEALSDSLLRRIEMARHILVASDVAEHSRDVRAIVHRARERQRLTELRLGFGVPMDFLERVGAVVV